MAKLPPPNGVMMNGRIFLSVPTVAHRLNVSKRTLYNWMQAGKIEWGEAVWGTRYVAVDSLTMKLSTGETGQIEVDAVDESELAVALLDLRPSLLREG